MRWGVLNMGINIDELRLILKVDGVDTDTYTDDELKQLITYYTKLFNNLISFNYTTIEYDEYIPLTEYTPAILTIHYPIQELSTLTIDDKDYINQIKHINHESGVIHFKESIQGDLRLVYTSGWSEESIDAIITPIIFDLTIYGLKYGAEGIITSLSEGDVSVSYDTGSSLTDLRERIADLNKRFGVKARMI